MLYQNNVMKLSALISYHYLVYVALAMLLSTNKFNSSCITSCVVKMEEVKLAKVPAEDMGKVLHSELLYRY